MPRPLPTPPAAPAPAAPARPSQLQKAGIARLAGVPVSTIPRALAGSTLLNAETRGPVRVGARARVRVRVRVPEDMRAVGDDDIARAAHFPPPLSTTRVVRDNSGAARAG